MSSLKAIYKDLDFENGDLLATTNDPSKCEQINWVERGEWLAAGKTAGAEKIFFVNNNPVAVFAKCGADLGEKVKTFNKVWCLARPRLLFLASPGEITVFDLAQKPLDVNKKDEEEWKNLKRLKRLDTLEQLNDVAANLQEFHRDNIESGILFSEKRFGNLKHRADKALIQDLKTVRRKLGEEGLSDDKTRYAHALIGRSIFIRYLEDRKILTIDYFLKVAKGNVSWTNLLKNNHDHLRVGLIGKDRFYPHILCSKEFTYALFRQLGRDFNGDMFPDVDAEEKNIKQKHLNLIQGLLYSDCDSQLQLFFHAYQFDIIPLDLISSIYEEFYHSSANEDSKKERVKQDGAYYTPTVLAEFLISRILKPEVLKEKPRVLDPACGSGIFLVEAFRRIVRYEWSERKRKLTFNELKIILKNQIAGIEINEEAARITAFSLYLSLLHYLDPPSINEQIKQKNRLPNLIADNNRGKNHYHCILSANAFATDAIESNPIWKKRFGDGCADVIVGNPPWGSVGTKASDDAKLQNKVMLEWCAQKGKPIGDNERSQAFLWRALDLLKKNGKAALLVNSGVLFNVSTTSIHFREQWFNSIAVKEIFNFSHVRKVFFKGAIAPFISIVFSNKSIHEQFVEYWSVKETLTTCNQQINISKNDLRIIRKENLADFRIWKVNCYGSQMDWEFLHYLSTSTIFKPLNEFIQITCVGYKKANRKLDADWLKNYKKLINNQFHRYNILSKSSFESVPDKVEHRGINNKIYENGRIIIKEGLKQSDGDYGRIIARYETKPFAFNHSVHVLKLEGGQDWQYKLLLGILWSSFARYFLFLSTSKWGLWYDKVLIKERPQLPVNFDKNSNASKDIIKIVDKLRNYHPQKQDILSPKGVPEEKIKKERRKWENKLDEAVFELYGLNEEQKDLIRDCCEVTLPFLYKPFDSIGAMPVVEDDDFSWIQNYAEVFGRRWNAYLGEDEEMRAEVHIGAHDNMLAVEFFPADKDDPWKLKPQKDTWKYIIDEIGKRLTRKMGSSQILLEGLVHVVSDNGIIIIKRNEKRFWTRSLAREDADTTLCKRMVETMPEEGRER